MAITRYMIEHDFDGSVRMGVKSDTREKTELEKLQDELDSVKFRRFCSVAEMLELEEDIRNVHHTIDVLDKLEENLKLNIKKLENNNA